MFSLYLKLDEGDIVKSLYRKFSNQQVTKDALQVTIKYLITFKIFIYLFFILFYFFFSILTQATLDCNYALAQKLYDKATLMLDKFAAGLEKWEGLNMI